MSTLSTVLPKCRTHCVGVSQPIITYYEERVEYNTCSGRMTILLQEAVDSIVGSQCRKKHIV